MSKTLPLLVRLPEPWKTSYELLVVEYELTVRKLQLRHSPRADDGPLPPQPLHHESLTFTDLTLPRSLTAPDEGNNLAWARAQRSPITHLSWSGPAPTVGQIWNVVHAIEMLHDDYEIFRADLSGEGQELLERELLAVGLATPHSKPSSPPGKPIPISTDHTGQLVFSRSSFWQGAGSPFGARPAWVADPDIHNHLRTPLNLYPSRPLEYTLTTEFPRRQVHALHPVRPPKPAPGSRIYSRYIPALGEFFSVYALDYTNEQHLQLFHTWQNDPRVAEQWKETGTLDEHREYLRQIHEDPHQMAVLAKFNDIFFSYHEIYWAKVSLPFPLPLQQAHLLVSQEDHLGAHYNAGNWDRGRHSLVGDTRFRGSQRVIAWWCSLMHYIFLDEPRTEYVTGEPKFAHRVPLTYDHATGMNLAKVIDLPHKRSALILGSRDKFFHVAPMRFDGVENLDRNPYGVLKL